MLLIEINVTHDEVFWDGASWGLGLGLTVWIGTKLYVWLTNQPWWPQ